MFYRVIYLFTLYYKMNVTLFFVLKKKIITQRTHVFFVEKILFFFKKKNNIPLLEKSNLYLILSIIKFLIV